MTYERRVEPAAPRRAATRTGAGPGWREHPSDREHPPDRGTRPDRSTTPGGLMDAQEIVARLRRADTVAEDRLG